MLFHKRSLSWELFPTHGQISPSLLLNIVNVEISQDQLYIVRRTLFSEV